jgi:hypothetical protein
VSAPSGTVNLIVVDEEDKLTSWYWTC